MHAAAQGYGMVRMFVPLVWYVRMFVPLVGVVASKLSVMAVSKACSAVEPMAIEALSEIAGLEAAKESLLSVSAVTGSLSPILYLPCFGMVVMYSRYHSSEQSATSVML
jgi:hypothetical protein